MKRRYHRPTLTVHGSATRHTKNRKFGDSYDWMWFRWPPGAPIG